RLLGWKVKIPIALKDLDNDQFVTLIAGPREYQELEKETGQIQKPLVVIKNALKNEPIYSKLLQDFAPLNQKFLDNVLNNILEKNDISPLERYQALISLHPLKDLNGRCTRLFFQKESGKPFYMFNWDQDIFITENNLEQEYKNYQQIVGGLKKNI
ncbi:MAG: hypothetical protein ACRYE8_00815, partial [Janthinobacterium lividum]